MGILTCKGCGQKFSTEHYSSRSFHYCAPCFACRTFKREYGYKARELLFREAQKNGMLTEVHKAEYIDSLKRGIKYTESRPELRLCYDELVSMYKNAGGE